MTDLTSSSDEEDRKKLLEAVDREFIDDDMFNGRQAQKESDKNKAKDAQLQLPPSLRVVDSEHAQDSNLSGLNLTPEFQQYVGRQLAAMIDKQLKEVEPRDLKKKKRKRFKNRVKLLKDSSDYIQLEATAGPGQVVDVAAKARQAASDEDSEEERAKIKDTVVDGDWLTSGQAVKGWVTSAKGEVLAGEHGVSLKTASGKKRKKKKRQENGNGISAELSV